MYYCKQHRHEKQGGYRGKGESTDDGTTERRVLLAALSEAQGPSAPFQ